MNMQSTRVIYISGAGRSGTTVLNDILDTVEGVAAFGEIWNTWTVAQDPAHLCGCGRLLAECETWFGVVGPNPVQDEIRTINEQRMAVARIRQGWRWRRLRDDDAFNAFAETVAGVYRSLASASGVDTVVDSSKTPAFALVAGSADSVDMRVVHLVRDPRAVIASWSRQKSVTFGTTVERLETRRFIRIVRQWIFFNTVGLSLLKRRFPTLVVRMEDLVANPATVVDAIRRFAEIDRSSPLVNQDGTITIGGAHTVAGNPDRFTIGPTLLRAPETWRTSLPLWKRVFVTVVTFPVMLRFGYYTWRGRARSDAIKQSPT